MKIIGSVKEDHTIEKRISITPDTHPSNSPGLKSIDFGDGKVIPSGYLGNLGREETG